MSFCDFNDFFDLHTPSLFNYKTETYDSVNSEYIKDSSEKYEITLLIPGFDKKDISVSISGNSLIVRAKNNIFSEISDIERTFEIPVSLEKPEIKYTNGILQIVFKKDLKETKLSIL